MDNDSEGRHDAAPLAERLRERIQRQGPVTFRDWMHAALYDEREGYYRRRDLTRWGRSGDYRTAPETTPLFAATFARFFARLHEELGSPDPLTVVEAGAGAGHFAHTLLRTLERDFPKLFSSLRYVLDEVGEDSRERAARHLAPFGGVVEFKHLNELGAPLPAGIIFSNELLDALPVHRAVMRGGELLEIHVGLDARGQFKRVEKTPSTPLLGDYLAGVGANLEDGQVAEINLEAVHWLALAARSLADGFVVTVDYGAEADNLYRDPHRRAGTLRGFAHHRFADDLLADPGAIDLTTTVDWTHAILAGERAGLRHISLEPLDRFLLRAGLLQQLERESALAPDEAHKAQLSLGARELLLPAGMAASFQVLVQRKSPHP